MNKKALASVVCGALLAVLPIGKAEADTSFEDQQACVTEQETNTMPRTSKAATEQHLDTSGWVVYNDGFFMIKHYTFCGHPRGWFAVSYVLTKRGWKYRASVLIYSCKSKIENPDGSWSEWETCDPNVPTDIEWFVLRGRGHKVVR